MKKSLGHTLQKRSIRGGHLRMLRLSSLFLLAFFLTVTASTLWAADAAGAGKKVKAGFIYVGPIGDYGWSNAHEMARQKLVKTFSWLETTYVESVGEADSARVIDRLINEEKCDIIFTTSFGYMNDTAAAAERYPDKTFMHCAGYKRGKNLGTYFAELYQMYYLNGLMAGALSKSAKIGYVGAHPIPEVVRHINAFALGVKEVNPKAKISVKWLFSWYDPAKGREAAEALVAEGCDALAFTEDSPSVVQVGEDHTAKGQPVYTFSHYSPMQKFGEKSAVSGQLVDWTPLYEDILLRFYTGVWEPKDYWWLAGQNAVRLGASDEHPINPNQAEALKKAEISDPVLGKISVYDLVMKRLEQMREPTILFDPFTGPIKDQKGESRIKAGERGSHDQLWSMDWFVDNVEGTIPK